MSWHGRVRAAIVGLSLCAGALLSAPALAQEEGLFELRLTAVPHSRTVSVLLDARGQPLLPLLEVAAYLEVPTARQDGVLVLDWPPDVWRTEIDLATRVVRTAAGSFTVSADEWALRGGEPYVSAGALGRVLAGELHVDWESLSVLVVGRSDFPVARRVQNLARRRGRVPVELFDDEPAVAYPARSGGLAIGWGVAAARFDEVTQGSVRTALGAGLLGGALEGGVTLHAGEGVQGVRHPHARYSRAFPNGRLVRQLEVGDVASHALVSRAFRGVALSNQPLYAPRRFTDVLVRPSVPAGWEYEVYLGDHLVGVSTRGADDAVAVPVGYGTTPVRLRMLGPAGQERVQELVYLVPALQVPPGAWRYHLGGGVCSYGGCRAVAYADLHHGVAHNLTLGAGVEHVDADSVGGTRPYARASFNPTPAVQSELRIQPGAMVHGSVQRYHRAGGWYVAGGWRTEEGPTRLPEPVWFSEANLTARVGVLGDDHLVTVFARTRGPAAGPAAEWQAGAQTAFRRVQLGGAFESGYQADDVVSLKAALLVPQHLAPRLRSLNLNGRIDLTESGVRGLTLGTTFRPVERASVTAALTRGTGGGPVGFVLSVVTRMPSAYVQSNAFVEPGRSGVATSASGGMAVHGPRSLSRSPFEALGRAGIRGVVFYDDDGDGVRGPGEAPAAGVPVVAGGERTVTDASGAYAVWGLLPYRVAGVAVDTLNLTDTDVSAGRAEHVVRPTPNLYTRQDLALVRTREAFGRLEWTGPARGLGGITVLATRDGDGAAFRAVSFSDGEFYFARLPAGSYRLSVAESSLRALRAGPDGEAPRLVVPGAPGGPLRAPAVPLRAEP